MVKDVVFNGKNNNPIRIKLYAPAKPKAVIVVIHGMQEHSGRYENFATICEEKQVAVITSDLRGHGDNAPMGPGLDEGSIYLNIVEDQKSIIEKARELVKDVPVVVMGHSYGSFVTQRLIKDRVGADMFILSGSSYMKGAIVSAGKMVAKVSKLFKGRDAEAKMIENMSIKGYGKNFEGGNWLSRDNDVWVKYQEDSRCGQAFPVAFYESMFTELPKNYSNLKNSVGYKPTILILSGDMDPVGNYGKGVKKLAEVYEDAGFDVTVRLYEGGRHEMLNELNRNEVIADILEWINVASIRH